MPQAHRHAERTASIAGDTIAITEAGDLETARRHIGLTGGPRGMHGADPFKLILVDLELPDGNGMELLAELAQYPSTKIVTALGASDPEPIALTSA